MSARLRLLTRPLQNHVIYTADKQIKQTKKALSLPEAKGVLLLSNDGNVNLEPYNLYALVNSILKKRQPDGSPQYSSIDAVAFFSTNMLVSAPALTMPAFFWLNGVRESSNDVVSGLLERLETNWYKWLSERLGFQIPRVKLSHEEVENLKYF